jgi:hypothetical protein
MMTHAGGGVPQRDERATAGAELSQSPLIVTLQVNNYFWLTKARGRNHMIFPLVNKMFIETIVFLVFVVAIAAVVVKVYEWRQDVLYGPYLGRRSERNRPTDQI